MRFHFPFSRPDGREQAIDWRSGLITTLRLLVLSGLVFWLARSFQWASMLAALQAAHPYVLPLGLLLMFTGQALAAWRFQYLLAAQNIRLSYWQSLRLTLACAFASNFLPSTVGGDLIRVAFLARAGHGLVRPAVLTLGDRLINLTASCLLLPAIVTLPLSLRPGTSLLFNLGGAGLLAAVTGTVVAWRWPALRARVANLPWPNAIRSLYHTLETIVRLWATRPGVLGVALVISFGVVFAGIGAAWEAALGLGIAVGWGQMTAAATLIGLVNLLPISVNGLGLQEASWTYFLARLGATAAQALALALLVRVFYVGVSLLGALDVVAWWKTSARTK